MLQVLLLIPFGLRFVLQKIRARVKLDVQVPAWLRFVCSLGAHLRLLDAECVRYFLVGVRGRLASGSNIELWNIFSGSFQQSISMQRS
jgi:hypothetical protein